MPFRKSRIVKIVSFLLCFSLICQQAGFAQVLPLIQPPALSTPLLRYISVNSSNPFHYFNFLMAKDSPLLGKEGSGEILGINQEAKKLVNYFLLGISLPSEDFWVNLNPQESDSVTSDKLANTDLGRVLLEQDLMLKRDAAKYLHPQNSVGKVFWTRLYQGIEENQGDGSVDSGVRQTKSTEPSPNFTRQSSNLKKLKITANTRVWIVPAKTVVLETGSGAFVAEAKLKVLSENEYLKVTSHKSQVTSDASLRGAAVGGDEAILSQNKNDDNIQILSEQLIRQIILPALTKDVNESPAYAPLRQIYSSLILAEWYKKKHGKSDSSVLPFEKGGSGGISPYAPYINSGNITGLESEAPWQKDKYYQEYLKSYTQGEYNIRDTIFNIKRMYFSGGIALFGANAKLNGALPIITTHSPAELLQQGIDFSAVKKRFSSALVGIQAGANGVKPEKIEVVALNSEATPDSAASSVISKGKLVTAFTSLSLLSDWIYSNLASATEVFTKNGVLEKISFEAGKGNTLGHLGLKLKGLGDALPSSLSFLNEGSIWTGGRLEKLRLTLQDLPGGSKIFGNNIDKVFPGSFGDVSGLGITQKIQQTVNTAATILPKFNEPLGVYPDDLSSLPNLSPSTDPGTLENIWQWFSANQYYQQEILIGLAIFGAAGLAWKLYQKNKKADQGQAEAPIASSLYEKMVNPFKNMLSAFFEKLKGEKKVESKEEEAKPVIETNSENPVVSTEEENPLQVDKLSEVTEGDGAEQPVQSVEDEGVPSEEVVQGYKQEEGSPVELKEIKETDERYEEEFKRFEHQEALQESLETPLVIPKLPTATPKTVKKLFEKLLDAKSQSEIEKLRVFILKEVGNAKGINNTQKEAILQVVEILIGKVVLRLEAIASGIKTKKQEQKEADLRKTAVDASADFELALTLDELIQLHTAIKTQVNDSLQKGNIDEATHSRLIGLLKEAFQKAEEQLKKENEQVKAEEKAGVEKSADVTMPAAQPEQSGQAKEEAPQAQNKRHLRDKVKARIDNLLNLTAVNKLEKEALVIELFINDEASVFSAEQREILLKRLHSIYDKAKQQLERKPVDSSELNQMQYAFKEAFRKKTEKEIKSLVSVVDDNERGQKAEEIRKKITESVLLDNSEKSGLLSALDAVKPKSPENQGDGSVDFGASQIKSTEPSPSFKPADTEKPESKAVEVKAQETVVSQVTDKSGAVVEFGKPGYRFTDKEASDAYYKKGGWKLHLTVKPENYKAVDRWLFANHKGSYKLLQGGDSGEKDFTIYIGDRRASEAFAKKMESEIGNILEKSNAGSVDRLFTEKVAGRFDIQRTELGNKLGFIYYGGNGIPFDMRVIELVHQVMWSKSETDKSKIKANINTRRQLIENALEKEYGEYFTGIKTKDEKTESLIESKPAEVILAAKDENQGDGSVDFGVKPIKSTEPSPSFKPADTEKPESKPVEASQESVLPQSAEIEPEMGVGNLVKTNPELQSLIKIKKELSELFSDKKMGKISGEEYKNKQKELIEKKNLILKKLAEGYDAMVSDYYKRLDETLAALRMAGVSEEEINAKYLPILKAERGQFEYIEMEEIKLIDQKESPTIKGENQGNVSPDEATIEIAAEHKGVVKVDAAGKDLKLEQIKELVGSEKVAIEEIIQKINLLKEYKDTDYFSKFELSLKNILPAGWKIKNLMFDAPHNPENWYLLGLLHPSGKFMLGIPRRCFNYDGFDRYFDNQEKTISRGLRISQFIKPAIIVEESGGKFFALEKGLVSASSAITEKRGGIDFSNIEIAIKDEGYVSSLNAVDRKILLAASALKIDEWTDLAFVYLYEAKQLMEDRIVNTAVNTKLLSEVMDLLRNTTSLSPQATQALQFSKP